jgi:hypothetical protein
MKSFAIAAIIATVTAEVGYTCTNDADATWTETAPTAVDAAACGTACTDTATDTTMDYCCRAMTTAAVAAVEDDAATADVDETAAATDASFACALFTKATAADATIKALQADADGVSYEAWAWNAGVAAADMAGAEEVAADSASMISSAIATIAAIAMVAY